MSDSGRVILNGSMIDLIMGVKEQEKEKRKKRKPKPKGKLEDCYPEIKLMHEKGHTTKDIAAHLGYCVPSIGNAKMDMELSLSHAVKARLKALSEMFKDNKVTTLSHLEISEKTGYTLFAVKSSITTLKNKGLINTAGAGRKPKTEWIGANEL